MLDIIRNNIIFNGFTTEELEGILACSNAEIKTYLKNEIIFSQEDPPKSLFILETGLVTVCNDDIEGKRNIISMIEPSEMFGEVFLFLNNVKYTSYSVATQKSTVLEIPKEFFFKTCANSCGAHSRLIQNMLCVLSQKAFYLNTKVGLLSCSSIREKILRYLTITGNGSRYVKLGLNRDQLADYLNVTRPSLSRELMKMQSEGILEVDRDTIKIIEK